MLKYFNKLTYANVHIEDVQFVDFSQVGETSAATVRENLLTPPTEFVLKWNTEPTFIMALLKLSLSAKEKDFIVY